MVSHDNSEAFVSLALAALEAFEDPKIRRNEICKFF